MDGNMPSMTKLQSNDKSLPLFDLWAGIPLDALRTSEHSLQILPDVLSSLHAACNFCTFLQGTYVTLTCILLISELCFSYLHRVAGSRNE